MKTIAKLDFELKSAETTNEKSAQLLQGAQKSLGFVPNMYRGMANNTALFDAYMYTYETFRKNAGFSPIEQEVIFLSAAYENDCHYCMAAHSFVADKVSKVPSEITNAIRNGEAIPDRKLAALSQLTRDITLNRGLPSTESVDAFFHAGYTKTDYLGVVAGVGVKTLSNYFNHIANTPVDDTFASRVWKKESY